MTKRVAELFRLDGRVAIITGGAGMLGIRHAEAIAEMGGIPVLLDNNEVRLEKSVKALGERFGKEPRGYAVDVTSTGDVEVA